MKKTMTIGIIVSAGVLTAVVSIRLSTDALSILVGVILGVAAILPTIILAGYLLKKNQEAMAASTPTQQVQPPVVVVSGGMMPPQYFQPQSPQQASQSILPPPAQSAPRKFHLMGYEDADGMELSDEDWISAS